MLNPGESLLLLELRRLLLIFKMKKVEKVWGSEEWIVNNDRYCGKILNLTKGYRGSMHYHKNKHETFYILEGRVLMELDSERKVMFPGEVQEIRPYGKHRFTGLEDSKIIEFSTHHDDEDTYRDRESEKVDLESLEFVEVVRR
jgi:mannose-6-phosphate isomerase